MKDEKPTPREEAIIDGLRSIFYLLDERLPKEEPAWKRDGIIPTLQGSARTKEAEQVDDATNARYKREDAEARQDERRVNVTITDVYAVPDEHGFLRINVGPEGATVDPDARNVTVTDGGRVGLESAPAPADDLPGEPVEPGDLRAGDRVAFTWEGTGERIIGALAGDQGGDVLRSDTPDSEGHHPNVVGRDSEWCGCISDVRLIERAPREDDDPDEALAMDLFHASLGLPPVSEIGPSAYGDNSVRERFLRMARDTRNMEVIGKAIEQAEAERDAARALLDDTTSALIKARDERDEWKAKHAALHADVVREFDLGVVGGSVRESLVGILDRDDERAAKGEQR